MPKPTSSNAIQPPMPKIVMKNRFLYRIRLRTVDFWLKFSRLHSQPTRSSNTLFPALGGSGRMSTAGTLRSSRQQADSAASTVQATARKEASREYPGFIGVSTSGRLLYMILYAWMITAGSSFWPTTQPSILPSTLARSA